jgi:hypothetical protein
MVDWKELCAQHWDGFKITVRISLLARRVCVRLAASVEYRGGGLEVSLFPGESGHAPQEGDVHAMPQQGYGSSVMFPHELTRGGKAIPADILVNRNRLSVVHVVSGMYVRWDYFVLCNEAPYLHAE